MGNPVYKHDLVMFVKLAVLFSGGGGHASDDYDMGKLAERGLVEWRPGSGSVTRDNGGWSATQQGHDLIEKFCTLMTDSKPASTTSGLIVDTHANGGIAEGEGTDYGD